MAFILQKTDSPRVVKSWPVVIPESRDEGKIHKEEIAVDFLLLPQSRIDEQIEASRASGGSADNDILREVLQGWSGMVDAAGNPVPFDSDSLDTALSQSNIRAALVSAYFDAVAGRKPQRKN